MALGISPRAARMPWAAAALAAAAISAWSNAAHAGCTTTPIMGGVQVVCEAATPPDPTVAPVAIASGDNVVQIFSGTYTANFTIAGGANTILMTGGQIAANFITGAGADQFTMQAGTITGNIDQATGPTRSPCPAGLSDRCSRAAGSTSS